MGPLKVFEPWDLLRGKDVFRDRSLLDKEMEESSLTHFAPNCATFSRAREIPIKGVANPPRPLRSSAHPLGIPEEVGRLSKKARARLENDSFMAQDSGQRAMDLHRRGRKFSLEHPLRSIAMDLDEWIRLKSEPGVYFSEYHTCMFEGSRRKKAQALIHNVEGLRILEKTCSGGTLCDRTGKPHERWRPVVAQGRVHQYITGEEREYLVGFCEKYAEGLSREVRSGSLTSFLEIYSGPNAPLSDAIAKKFLGRRLDDILPRENAKVTSREGASDPQGRTQREAQTGDHSTRLGGAHSEVFFPTGRVLDASPVEFETNRVLAVASGRQPSFGKRNQMIRDGIDDPVLHMKRALQLSHPFDGEGGLKTMHRMGLDWELSCVDPDTSRRKTINSIKSLKGDPATRRRDLELKELSSISFKQLGQKLDLGLMEAVQKIDGVEDELLPLLCARGMPITGRALESPFFLTQEEPQKVSRAEFMNSARKRQQASIRRTKYMAELGGPEMAIAIWEKAKKEINEGSMGPSMSMERIKAKYGESVNIIPSFGLSQGVDSGGRKKFRRIDDHTAGWTNLAAKRMQKIEMANTDYIATMVKSMSSTFQGEQLTLSTADMRAAYRQVALADTDIPLAITAIYDPKDKEVKLHEMFAQPFGAGHAVPNFYRLAEWFCRIACRTLHIQCDHFFDDYWIVSREQHGTVAQECMLELAQLFGISFDPEKTQLPSRSTDALGVVFDLSDITKGKFLIKAKESRARNLISTIDSCVQVDSLTSSQAASIVGKFGFLCSTLFGKAGRCASLGVRARQYSSSDVSSMTHTLLISLRLMQEFLRVCPPREILLHNPLPPFILYSDASDVPERASRFGVGGTLIDQRFAQPILQHFSWEVPQGVVDRWIMKQAYMGQLELLAGPVSLFTWRKSLSNSKVFHFVDNNAASACLIKGYSPKTDSSELVGVYWLAAAAHKVSIYIDRVESKSNLSDGPSRFDHELLRRLGSEQVNPSIPSNLFLSKISSWFESPFPAEGPNPSSH